MKIKTAFTLAIGCAVLVTFGALTLADIYFQQKKSKRALYEQLKHSSELIANNSQSLFDTYNVGALRSQLQRLKSDQYIAYTYALDHEGRVITDGTDDNPDRDKLLTDPFNVTAIASDEMVFNETSEYIEIGYPVFTGTRKVGAIRTAYSTKLLSALTKQMVMQDLAVTVPLTAIIVLLSLIVAKYLFAPFRSLMQQLKTFDINNPHTIDVSESRNEAAELGHEFNDLISRLIDTTASKEDLDKQIAKQLETEQQLSAALEEANIAVEAKAQFLASMSHEIRTPMNGVIGMLGLLSKTSLNDDQEHKVRLAKSSAESLLNIINDILDFSKVEAGKLELEALNFSLTQMLGDFCESIAMRAQEKNLELILDTQQIKHPWVVGDPGRIGQIINNLIGNAIKFTDHGDICVTCSTERIEDTIELRCRVVDSGIGIPEDKRNKLFAEFTQVDSSTTRKYGGTGLGLSICKKLVELMDGSIGIDGRDDNQSGAVFWFSVRLGCGEVEQSQTMLDEVLEAVKGSNVLVVDDNETNLAVIEGQLQHYGLNVHKVCSAALALKYLQSHAATTQAVILDMQMPQMDGEELTKRIRAIPEYQHLYLIMMTSLVHDNESSFYKEIGLDGFYTKPTTETDIHRALGVIANINKTPSKGDSKQSTTTEVVHHLFDANTRILLVDDNQVNLFVAQGLLEELGLSADTAGNGLEALASIANAKAINEPYDLVLMDCQMPELDGYEATEQLRQIEAHEPARSTVIAMTANAMQGDRERCIAAGMDDYLSKPIDQQKLAGKLAKWLST